MFGQRGSGTIVPISAIEQDDKSFSIQVTQKGRENFSEDVMSVGHKRMQITKYIGGGMANGVPHKMTEFLSGVNVISQSGFIFKTAGNNTVNIYIGGSPMKENYGNLATTPQGIPLTPGEAFFINITNLSNLYVIASADPSAGVADLFWLDM